MPVEDQTHPSMSLAVLLPHSSPGPAPTKDLVLERIVISVHREGQQVSLGPNLRRPCVELPIVRLGMPRVSGLPLRGANPVGSRRESPSLVLKRVAHRRVRRESQPSCRQYLLEGPLARRVVVKQITIREF